MDKEFFLIRHAESLGNIGLGGGYDPGLSPRGHAQASHCGEVMRPFCSPDTLILSSPFERCLMTSEIIAELSDLQVTIMPALHEHFAVESFPLRKVKFDSMRAKAEKHPLVTGIYDDTQWWPEENEQKEDLNIRMSIFRNNLIGPHFSAPEIICVGHLPSLIALAESMVPDINIERLDNCGVIKINYKNGKFSVEFVNALCLQD